MDHAIKEDAIATLAAEEVDGTAFVGLTSQMLREMGLKTGAISRVMQTLNILKGPTPEGALGVPEQRATGATSAPAATDPTLAAAKSVLRL